MPDEGMKMTYSAIVRDSDNKKIVRVAFERKKGLETQIAEGVVPDGKITSQNGYSPDEIAQLENYLRENAEDIMAKAKVISNPLKWL